MMTDPHSPSPAPHGGAAPAQATPLDAASLAHPLAAVRAGHPLVQCITNVVTVNFVANALLAVGAAPAMVDFPGEADLCARAASALLINLGTPREESIVAMREAAAAAHAAGTPWVLDPVAAGFLPKRTRIAIELLELAPTIVRGNASEIIALAGAGRGGRGVDSTASSDSAVDAAVHIAARTGGAVAVSGATDIITDRIATVRLRNGHPWLTQVTGGGCALGAVMAAFAGVRVRPLVAAAAATAAYTIAAELAAAESRGPGSFAVALIDQLSAIAPATIEQRVVLG